MRSYRRRSLTPKTLPFGECVQYYMHLRKMITFTMAHTYIHKSQCVDSFYLLSCRVVSVGIVALMNFYKIHDGDTLLSASYINLESTASLHAKKVNETADRSSSSSSSRSNSFFYVDNIVRWICFWPEGANFYLFVLCFRFDSILSLHAFGVVSNGLIQKSFLHDLCVCARECSVLTFTHSLSHTYIPYIHSIIHTSYPLNATCEAATTTQSKISTKLLLLIFVFGVIKLWLNQFLLFSFCCLSTVLGRCMIIIIAIRFIHYIYIPYVFYLFCIEPRVHIFTQGTPCVYFQIQI